MTDEQLQRIHDIEYSCDSRAELAERIVGLEDDNAKLREQLAKARDPQRIGGTAGPESFVYAIEQLREFRWQHATNDEDAIPYINNVAAAHERENGKLRELVKDMRKCLSDECKRCREWGDVCDLDESLRELLVEVDT